MKGDVERKMGLSCSIGDKRDCVRISSAHTSSIPSAEEAVVRVRIKQVTQRGKKRGASAYGTKSAMIKEGGFYVDGYCFGRALLGWW